MLLVDALYVNYGGALNLLCYLVDTLNAHDVRFTLLADARCAGQFDYLESVEYRVASIINRRDYYKANTAKISTVLCFGNVPPPLKMPVPVFTYFHNINMLTLADCRDLKQKLMFGIKRQYIRIHKKHTDEWFVQTSNTARELMKHLTIPADKVKLFPFYKLPLFPQPNSNRNDYIFVGEYSGAKGHNELLEAWEILHDQGIDRTLHLTVSLGDDFLRKLQRAINNGVKIVNHGYVSMDQLVKLYMQSKATVYPSHNESFGLGLVEALEAGCDVIASDRPYVYSICNPSEVFNPSSPSSIVDAIMKYEQSGSIKSKLLIKNSLIAMIERIVS